jgi:hypothetical protein
MTAASVASASALLDPVRAPASLGERFAEAGPVLGSRDHDRRLSAVEAGGQVSGHRVGELLDVAVHLDGVGRRAGTLQKSRPRCLHRARS